MTIVLGVLLVAAGWLLGVATAYVIAARYERLQKTRRAHVWQSQAVRNADAWLAKDPEFRQKWEAAQACYDQMAAEANAECKQGQEQCA